MHGEKIIRKTSFGLIIKTQPMSEKRILNCELTSTSVDDCDVTSYVIKVGAIVAPGLLIGMCLFFATFLFCSFRFCCNCCGGRQQSANMCCPPSKDKHIPARYSYYDILRAKVFMWLVAGVGVAALIWGNSTSSQVVNGLNGLADAIQGVPSRLTDKIDEMDESLTVQLYDAAKNATETVALMANSSLKTEVEKVRNDLDGMLQDSVGEYQSKANDYSFVLFIIFSVPSAVVICGAPLALFNIRKYLPMLLVWITFILGTFVWIVHGVFAGTSFVMDGLCTEISGAANNRRNIISALSGCESSTFTDYLTSFKDLRKEQAKDACENFNKLCYDTSKTASENLEAQQIYDCGASGAIVCTDKDLPEISEEILSKYTHANIVALPNIEETGGVCLRSEWRDECTIPRCAEDCKFSGNNTLSPVGRFSKQVESNLNAAVVVSSTIDSIGNQFANCDAILSYMLQDFDEPCQSMVKGMTGARDSSGMQGFACLGGIYALVFGSKRFLSNDYVDVALKEEDDDGDNKGKKTSNSGSKYQDSTLDGDNQEMNAM